MGLAGVLATRGEAAEGRRIVAKVHGWFTESHDTEDLVLAKKLLHSADSARTQRRKRR